ncbi:GNAT family N-acetyltransferase [Rhodovulum adriaticum]|uniref:Acetyltransferase (GNAT) family protein n=1 Tax=Rhodovulum adriaticum TaxID=35804 RepID=A0A4R2NYX6_RHOAD|nr:GNAT family N-acetyltransferase [Rhodovulum adriaticum]MBK1634979.1 GNAT family N-acetyltransferase [Rhodovulum adriaticum]TCP27450.1 acetyltransferase (GNAT) family protein [Rhodovulum adriaticum]
MSLPDLFAGQEATWPPAATHRVGPWCIRDGQGGGKRVSAATATAPVTDADIAQAETAMAALDQDALFMVRPGDEALDGLLALRGYRIVDPVMILAAPVAPLAAMPPPPVTAFTVAAPLAILHEVWAENGIGPARLAVMDRVKGPKTALLARQNDRAAGAGFAAIHGTRCFVHALSVSPAHRRQGAAVNMMRAAAGWAQDHGAETLVVLVTEDNAAARALYASLGFANVGSYHYRTNAPQGR